MTHRELTCFKAYDIRGEIGVNIDEDITYRIGRAVAQHFSAKSLVIGIDACETSLAFAQAAARGVADAGAAIDRVLAAAYRGDAVSLDETDGVGLTFKDWRL